MSQSFPYSIFQKFSGPRNLSPDNHKRKNELGYRKESRTSTQPQAKFLLLLTKAMSKKIERVKSQKQISQKLQEMIAFVVCRVVTLK
jgi:hypothetical protein